MTKELYPFYTFRDPLLSSKFMVKTLESNENHSQSIDFNVFGDPFLNAYIEKLDEEIYSEVPIFSNPQAETIWIDNQLDILFTSISDETRKHGWAVVQFYEDETWKVFSGRHYVDWIKEIDADGRFNRIGVRVLYHDELGNNYEEDLLFGEDNLCFLITWKKSNTGYRYAEPDLNQSILTIAYMIRQINGQLSFAGVKPSFLHFVYGDDISPGVQKSIAKNIQYVDRSAGIGARETQLSEIREISTGDIEKIDKALDKQLKIFSGATRLPLSFYIGEREKGGLSDTGENADTLKIDRKKNYIFNHIKPYMKSIFLYRFGIDTEIDIYKEINMSDINGQKDQETNIREEIN